MPAHPKNPRRWTSTLNHAYEAGKAARLAAGLDVGTIPCPYGRRRLRDEWFRGCKAGVEQLRRTIERSNAKYGKHADPSVVLQ